MPTSWAKTKTNFMKKLLFGLFAAVMFTACTSETNETKIETSANRPPPELYSADENAMIDEYLKAHPNSGPHIAVTNVCSWGSATNGGTCGYINGQPYTSIRVPLAAAPTGGSVSYQVYSGFGHCLCYGV